MTATFLKPCLSTTLTTEPLAIRTAILDGVTPDAKPLTARQQCAAMRKPTKPVAEKADIPTINIPALDAAFARAKELKNIITTADNELKELSAAIKKAAESEMDALGVGSIKINGASTLVTYPKFKTFEESDGDALKRRFNGRFATLFTLASYWEPTELLKKSCVCDPDIMALVRELPQYSPVTALTIK